jgi:hypothetical protein
MCGADYSVETFPADYVSRRRETKTELSHQDITNVPAKQLFSLPCPKAPAAECGQLIHIEPRYGKNKTYVHPGNGQIGPKSPVAQGRNFSGAGQKRHKWLL